MHCNVAQLPHNPEQLGSLTERKGGEIHKDVDVQKGVTQAKENQNKTAKSSHYGTA